MTNIFLVDVHIWNNRLNQPFSYMVDSIFYKKYFKSKIYGTLVVVEFNNKLQVGMIVSKKINVQNKENIKFKVNPIIKIVLKNELSPNLDEMYYHLKDKIYCENKIIHKLLFQKNNAIASTLWLSQVKKNENIINSKNTGNIKKNQYIKDCGDTQEKEEIEYLQKKYFQNESEVKYKKIEKVDRKICLNLINDKVINVKLKTTTSKIMKIYKMAENNDQNEVFLIKSDFIKKHQLTEYKFRKQLKNEEIIFTEVDEKSKYLYMEKMNLKTLNLSDEQKDAYQKIKNSPQISLLHGVTGSGKTSVFIELIKSEIQKNKQVLILVPEITLTIQMLEEINKYFNYQSAHFNNQITKKEHQKLIEQVKKNNIKIIIGTRSSIFLDIPNLSLVIVDEEHDGSYKQDMMPFYHINIMFDFWKNKNVKVLLSSATPSLKTYAKAKKNIYQLVELKQRYNDYKLPEIILRKYDKENIFSKEVINQISKKIQKNEKVLILFNIKGYSKNVICQNCGTAIVCPKCNISLTYFKESNNLECSFCDYSQKFSRKCDECDSTNLELLGMGIEKAQEILNKYFKGKVLKIDGSTSKAKVKLKKIIEEFKEDKGQILIGTQIIAKGLNFPNLNLVIVLNTDNMLFFNDYTSNEQAYQLLEQVSGRSGRNSKNGKVLIYTNYSNHQVYSSVKEHSYQKFYEFEMNNRRLQKTSPYFNIAMIEGRSLKKELLLKEFKKLENSLKQSNFELSKIIIPYVNKINDYYRVKIFLKYKRENMKEYLKMIFKENKMNLIEIIVDLEVNSYGS